MIPYGKQSISQADIEAVVEVLKSDFLTQGPKVAEFEKALAEYCGAKYAVLSAHGTDALHLAYLAAGLKAGDEVITSPNTFAATANMLLVVGARPVFCDIRLDSYNLDETQLKKHLTPRTKAIVPVHFAGQPCNMEPISEFAKKHNLIVIEDACHALGAKYQGNKIGGLASDMAVFSFHPVKAITTGEGGAILTNREDYYHKLTLLRNHGIFKDERGKNVMIDLGYNYRITDLQAALGLSQLRRLDEFIKKRHEVARWYEEAFGEQEEIILPQEIEGNYSGWHLYAIRVKDPNQRESLATYLKEQGIGVNFHYPAVYSHPYYRQNGYADVHLPCADEYHNTAITLPCHTLMTHEDVNYIANFIRKFYEKSSNAS